MGMAVIVFVLVGAVGLIWLLGPMFRPKEARTQFVLTTIIYKHLKFEGIIMSSKLNIKEFVKGTFGIVKHDDQTPIEATFANEKFTSADETIAKVAQDPTDTADTAIVDIEGVAEGETDITVEVDATYVDPITLQEVTKHKTAIVHVTISAPTSDTETDLVVTLGDPQPVVDQSAQ
ncbi:MAG TPA: hypothetical protein VGN00_14365 [Puia sp.]|jgi:hypothetical protein